MCVSGLPGGEGKLGVGGRRGGLGGGNEPRTARSD